MRKIAATYVFPVSHPPIKNGIVEIDDDGTIFNIIDTKGKLSEQANLEYYNGIITPGFVNTHCHIELSYLHEQIPEKLGLSGFLGQINKLRNEEFPDKPKQIKEADKELYRQGVVAVGDISNSTDSIDIKKNSRIIYHTFVEAFGFSPLRAERAFGFAKYVYDLLKLNDLRASITPHSPYSVSTELFKLIENHAEINKCILSIHNQESEDENDFFKSGTGGIIKHLNDNIGLDTSGWKPTGKSSLSSIINFLPEKNQVLFIHNTHTSSNDLGIINDYFNPGNVYFVLCPNSNLFIENKIPPIDLFMEEDLQVCIGTDSLASNHKLSMVDEMKTIQDHFPEISLNELIRWATLNGAKALKLDSQFGSIEKGKKPGINLLTGVDLHNLTLTSQSKVKRLV